MNGGNNGQRKRLLLAVALSGLILLAFDVASVQFFGRHAFGNPIAQTGEKAGVLEDASGVAAGRGGDAAVTAAAVAGDAKNQIVTPSAVVVRLPLENERVAAGISTRGGTLDQAVLKNYAQTLGEAAGYTLLKGEGDHAQRVEMGWVGQGVEGPAVDSVWQVEGDVNAPGKPVVLVWRNATGQAFQRAVSMRPDSYVLDVTERVVNGAAMPVTLRPFAQVRRADGDFPHSRSSWVNYFGPMGVAGDVTQEGKYATLKKKGASEKVAAAGGWWGVTDQYFVTALMGLEGQRWFDYKAEGSGDAAKDIYFARAEGAPVTLAAGGNHEVTYSLYVGPKQEAQLMAAGHELERAIDWGWFKAIAKPLYHTLVWLHGWAGNWAIAVMLLTALLKLVTFPLANKSYHAMAKMKKLQPKMEELKKRFANDQQGLALAMMELYKKEKVNPASGCWPMLIQIPIFFAMYKVVLVAFEFRYAPMGGWVHDLSAADPFYILPVLMGASMFVQFRLNPPPADPMQATMFKWMPVFMTVMFLSFPAGLVLYWLVNNVLSIGQQYYIMKKDKAV